MMIFRIHSYGYAIANRIYEELLDVIAQQGGLNADDADEYLDNLRQEKRYQRDVY